MDLKGITEYVFLGYPVYFDYFPKPRNRSFREYYKLCFQENNRLKTENGADRRENGGNTLLIGGNNPYNGENQYKNVHRENIQLCCVNN